MADETIPVAAPVPAPEAPAPAPVTAEPAAAAGTPQQQQRDALYQKFYGTTEANAPVAAPVEPEAPLGTAPVEVPVVPPVAATSPSTADVQSIVEATIRKLYEDNKAAQPAPVAPVVPAAVPVDGTAWTQPLMNADFKTATELLIAEVRRQIAPDIARSATSEAVEQFKAETDLNTFVNSIRTSNPDILPLEAQIGAKIQNVMSQWIQSQPGAVSPSAYVQQYKVVATNEINEARTIVQTIRASGAGTSAAVRQEVLSASTIPPTPVQTPSAPTSAVPAAQTTEGYMQQRANMELKRMGMLRR